MVLSLSKEGPLLFSQTAYHCICCYWVSKFSMSHFWLYVMQYMTLYDYWAVCACPVSREMSGLFRLLLQWAKSGSHREFLGSLKQIYFETKVHISHTWLWAYKEEDSRTMSDIELKCIPFWVCIPILHFLYITEDWNITKLFYIETPDFQHLKKINVYSTHEATRSFDCRKGGLMYWFTRNALDIIIYCVILPTMY